MGVGQRLVSGGSIPCQVGDLSHHIGEEEAMKDDREGPLVTRDAKLRGHNSQQQWQFEVQSSGVCT